MEGTWLFLVLAAIVLFGMPTALWWRYERRSPIDAVDPVDRNDPKVRIMQRIIPKIINSIDSDLERTRISYHLGDPGSVMTLIMDIEQFRHLRRKRTLWEHQGMFAEREIQRKWARRPPAVREWDGIGYLAPIAISAVFNAAPTIRTVRFWIGDTEDHGLTICRVSIEAERGQTKYDWRYDKRAKGYLAPVTPHGDHLPTLSVMGLAEDPYDFEQQVAQMLRNSGLVVEVTGGSGDEGIDVIAYDQTPITGGTYLVQCKRYSPDHKVGVSEVRELYGTMQEKRAAKGVLVTSSTFTTGALKFAEDKSIELINGAELSTLIATGGKPTLQTPTTDILTPVPDVYLRANLDFSEARDARRGDTGDLTELFVAIWSDDLQALARIINRGVDINAANEDGATALTTAILADNPAMTRMVLASGADADAKYGESLTPLLFAISSKLPDAVSILLEHGADPNLPSNGGMTPLSVAVSYSQLTAVSALINYGADVNRASNGVLPLIASISRVSKIGSSEDDLAVLVELIHAGADLELAREALTENGVRWLDDLLHLLDEDQAK